MTEATELYYTPRRLAEIAGKVRRHMSRQERDRAVRRMRNGLRRAGVLVERFGALVVSLPDLARVAPEVWERIHAAICVWQDGQMRSDSTYSDP